MSLRFETRLLADRYSEWLDANARGAPVAQRKAGTARTVVGNLTDAILGSAAATLYDNDVARTAIGLAYLARGGLATLGAVFAGMEIRLTGAGGSSSDPDVVAFNRRHRAASAVTNFVVGGALLTMVAGREAAMISASSGNLDLVAGPLAAHFTRPSERSIDELVGILANPKSDRHARVAKADLELIGAAALPALVRAARNLDGKHAARVLEVIRAIAWPPVPAEQAADVAGTIADTAHAMLRSNDVSRACELLGVMNASTVKALPEDAADRLREQEARYVKIAIDSPDDAAAARNRDDVGRGVAHALGRSYFSAAARVSAISSAIGGADFEMAKLAVLATGKEADAPLRAALVRATAAHQAAENATYVLARLEVMPLKEAFEGMPHEIPADAPYTYGLALKKMRDFGNVDHAALRDTARNVDRLTQEVAAYESMLAEVSVDRREPAHAGQPQQDAAAG